MSDPTHQNLSGLSSHKIPRAPGPQIHTISEADGEALDALLQARLGGADQGPTPPGLGDRTAKVSELLGLLDQDHVDDPPADLTARTMQSIRAQEQRKRFTQQVQMLAAPRRTLGVDWKQLVTAAAIFLIAATLLIPVMDRQQADSRRVAGRANLGRAFLGFSGYAEDNQGQLPRGNIQPGVVWTEVGQPQDINSRYVQSNSAHYFRLVNQGYAKVDDLTCPENEHAREHPMSTADLDWNSPEAVSFSYLNQYTNRILRLQDVPTMAVLADRNPLFEVMNGRIVFNPMIPLNAPSRAHRGTGQNVLTADGVATWRVRPTLDLYDAEGSDNFWAIQGVDTYRGNEYTDNLQDSFLVP